MSCHHQFHHQCHLCHPHHHHKHHKHSCPPTPLFADHCHHRQHHLYGYSHHLCRLCIIFYIGPSCRRTYHWNYVPLQQIKEEQDANKANESSVNRKKLPPRRLLMPTCNQIQINPNAQIRYITNTSTEKLESTNTLHHKRKYRLT